MQNSRTHTHTHSGDGDNACARGRLERGTVGALISIAKIAACCRYRPTRGEMRGDRDECLPARNSDQRPRRGLFSHPLRRLRTCERNYYRTIAPRARAVIQQGIRTRVLNSSNNIRKNLPHPRDVKNLHFLPPRSSLSVYSRLASEIDFPEKDGLTRALISRTFSEASRTGWPRTKRACRRRTCQVIRV